MSFVLVLVNNKECTALFYAYILMNFHLVHNNMVTQTLWDKIDNL